MSRTCNRCEKDRVVSKREFQAVYSVSTRAREDAGKVKRRLGHLFPSDKSAKEMLTQYLDRTPSNHPECICSWCLQPQYHSGSSVDRVRTAADAM